MSRIVATVLIAALLVGGLEFAADYNEVLDGGAFAALADGHTPDDGHDPDDHHAGCDICHFGGVHLTGLVASTVPPALGKPFLRVPWRAPVPALATRAPLDRPPIA